jgi:hypothetical protein
VVGGSSIIGGFITVAAGIGLFSIDASWTEALAAGVCTIALGGALIIFGMCWFFR